MDNHLHNIVATQDGHVLKIELCRPAKRNALTADMARTLADRLNQVADDPNTRAVHLTARGGYFCAGMDVKELTSGENFQSPSPLAVSIAQFPKPIVGSIRGGASGIGFTMLLHVDFLYLTPNVVCQIPFVDIGLTPELGMTRLLTERIGYARAAEVTLLEGKITAKQMVEWGLATNILDDQDLDKVASGTAHRMANKSFEAVLETRKLLKTHGEDILTHMKQESKILKLLLAKSDVQEKLSGPAKRRQD